MDVPEQLRPFLAVMPSISDTTFRLAVCAAKLCVEGGSGPAEELEQELRLELGDAGDRTAEILESCVFLVRQALAPGVTRDQLASLVHVEGFGDERGKVFVEE